MCSLVLDRAFQVRQPWCCPAMSVMRGLILFWIEAPAFRIKELWVSFAIISRLCHTLNVSPRFELKLFMNQLVVAVQLEANIIGQQLWIGSFFARPCWKRGLVCDARTFCQSSPNVRISCGLPSLHTEMRDVIREEDVRCWWQLFLFFLRNTRRECWNRQ